MKNAEFWAADASVADALPDMLVQLGFEVRPGQQATRRDLYLDTEDWRLYRAGVACRVRTADGEATVALEPVSALGEGLAPAAELEERIPAAPKTFPCAVPGERLARQLSPLMNEALVDVRVHLQRDETTCRASSPAGLDLEVGAEVIGVVGDKAAEPFARVRFTALSGSAEEIDELAGRIGLEPAQGYPLSRGLEAAGIEPPALVEGDDLVLRRDDRYVDAAYRVLRRHFNRMLWNEPGTRLGLDPEYLHDMRVAARRMRAALSVFRGALPQRRLQGTRRELKWLGDTLGRVRDLDVYLLHLEEETRDLGPESRPAMAIYVDRLRAEREKVRTSMLRALNTKRFGAFVQRFERFLGVGPAKRPSAPAAQQPVTIAARRVILNRLKRVLRDGRAIGSRSPDSDLHQLRIRCKRVRYACEFFVDIYGPAAEKFTTRVIGLQDLLGANQDAVVARETLARAAQVISVPRGKARSLYIGLGQLMALHAQRALVARGKFLKAWKRFDRKKVRKPLRSRLNRLRSHR